MNRHFSIPFFFFSIKKNEVLIRATGWMDFENMLNESSQRQKASYCMIPFI